MTGCGQFLAENFFRQCHDQIDELATGAGQALLVCLVNFLASLGKGLHGLHELALQTIGHVGGPLLEGLLTDGLDIDLGLLRRRRWLRRRGRRRPAFGRRIGCDGFLTSLRRWALWRRFGRRCWPGLAQRWLNGLADEGERGELGIPFEDLRRTHRHHCLGPEPACLLLPTSWQF